jgi:hypothetical protein
MELKNMSKKNEELKLDDDSVFVYMGTSSRSLIVEVICLDREVIELTYLALSKWFEARGLTFK